MAGQYWKVLDDGAAFRCKECGELKPHTQVILAQHTEDFDKRQMVCLECVDEEWMATAVCIGTTDELVERIMGKRT